MIRYLLLLVTVIFFALNMGASGIAPSFAAAYGGRLIKRKVALLLFTVCVVLGAVLLGHHVSVTLGKGLLPADFLHFDTALIILAASSLSLFLANSLKIPQSTSQVTVSAIVGAGLYYHHLHLKTLFLKIIPAWIILPCVSFLCTLAVCRRVYPPRHGNLRIYEKIFVHEKKMKLVALLVSGYVAFAIGSNNVANAVGPLFGAGIMGIAPGLLFISPLFGLGAWVLGRGTLETAGKEIVPLGVVTSTLTSFVTATLLIIASLWGIPQSLVQLNIFSLFAISCLKNGHKNTFELHLTRKTFLVWLVTPLLSIAVSYLLLFLVNKFT